jgi:hypothetical protein
MSYHLLLKKEKQKEKKKVIKVNTNVKGGSQGDE